MQVHLKSPFTSGGLGAVGGIVVTDGPGEEAPLLLEKLLYDGGDGGSGGGVVSRGMISNSYVVPPFGSDD